LQAQSSNLARQSFSGRVTKGGRLKQGADTFLNKIIDLSMVHTGATVSAIIQARVVPPQIQWLGQLGISDILKVVGILVAGVLGVLGTITETRDKENNQITLWGRCVLALTVAGSLLALGSQVVDSITSNERDHTILQNLQEQSNKANSILTQDSNILSGIRQQSTTTNELLKQNGDILTSTHAQSTVATTSLRSIQDLLSQVDSIQIEAEFELPQSDSRVAALAREFHQWANSDGSVAASCQVFHPHERFATISCIPFDPSQEALRTKSPSLGLLKDVWRSLPMFTPRVWVNQEHETLSTLLAPGGMNADLFMFNDPMIPSIPTSLIYYESNGKIYIRPPSFNSNSKNSGCWLPKETVIGVHTLARAKMVVEFGWNRSPDAPEPDPLLYSIQPDYIRLTAGPNTFFLHPKNIIEKPEELYDLKFVLSEFSEVTLPDVKEFLHHRAASPPVRQQKAVIPR
jgi:hypothetical protein